MAEFGGESPLLFIGFAPKEFQVLQLKQLFRASCFVEVVQKVPRVGTITRIFSSTKTVKSFFLLLFSRVTQLRYGASFPSDG